MVVFVVVGAVLSLDLALVAGILIVLVQIIMTYLFARIVVLVREKVHKVRLRVPEEWALVVDVGHEEGLG